MYPEISLAGESQEPLDIKVACLTSPEAAVTKVTVTAYGVEHAFVGHAKKHPKDVANEPIGAELSLSRALMAAAEYFHQEAFKLVDFNTNEEYNKVLEHLDALSQYGIQHSSTLESFYEYSKTL